MKKRYMLILFPVCYDKWKYIEKFIERNLSVILKKKIDLDDKMKFDLISILYQGEPWIRDYYNDWEGIHYKMDACFNSNIQSIKLFYVLSNEKKIIDIKMKIREFSKCGKHSIHSTDYEETADKLKNQNIFN